MYRYISIALLLLVACQKKIDTQDVTQTDTKGKSMAEDTDYLDYSGHITYIDNLETAGTKSVGQTVSLMLILSF